MVAPRRVLLVDDHDDTRELLAALCELLGHAVETAATGADAIGVADSFRPDIAFIDLRLPDINGFEVAAALRRQFGSACQLVALSGLSTNESRDQATRDGFDTYIVKPIDAKRLEQLIAKC